MEGTRRLVRLLCYLPKPTTAANHHHGLVLTRAWRLDAVHVNLKLNHMDVQPDLMMDDTALHTSVNGIICHGMTATGSMLVTQVISLPKIDPKTAVLYPVLLSA